MSDDGRKLAVGEVRLLRSVFANRINYGCVEVYHRRWMSVFPKNRAMTPNGNVYFPGSDYHPDFSANDVSIEDKITFIHEGTHLYQWYGLGQTVWLRGPFSRNYNYELESGKKFTDYGLEQMGMIAQHYYTLKMGYPTGLRFKLPEYEAILPVK